MRAVNAPCRIERWRRRRFAAARESSGASASGSGSDVVCGLAQRFKQIASEHRIEPVGMQWHDDPTVYDADPSYRALVDPRNSMPPPAGLHCLFGDPPVAVAGSLVEGGGAVRCLSPPYPSLMLTCSSQQPVTDHR